MWSGVGILIPMAIGAVVLRLAKILPEVFKDEGQKGATVAQTLLRQRAQASRNAQG